MLDESQLVPAHGTQKTDRKNSRFYCVRGYIWFAENNLDLAAADFNRAIELDPKLAQGYEGRGAVRLGKGQVEAALVDLNFALQLDASLTRARQNRGFALLMLGKDEDAEKDFAAVPGAKPELKEN